MPSPYILVYVSFLVHRLGNIRRLLALAHGVKVDAGHAALDQLFALCNGPFGAQGGHVLVRSAFDELHGERLRKVYMEELGHEFDVTQQRKRLDARDDGHRDAGLAAFGHKVEELSVVVKELGYDVIGPGVDLLLQEMDVERQVGRLEVFLRVTGHTHAEIERIGVFYVLVHILAAAQVADLLYQLQGAGIAALAGYKMRFGLDGIAPQRQHIVYAQETEVDEGVLGLVARETAADQVRYRLDIVLVLNGGADTYRARAFAYGHLFQVTFFAFFVNVFLAVVGYVYVRRIEGQQGVDGLVDMVDVFAFLGRKYLERKQGTAFAEFIGDSHYLRTY